MADNNHEGKRYVIKGTPITDPYTGKPRMVIEEEKLAAAEAAAGAGPLLELLPYVKKTAAIVATGSEVKKGLIQDTFTPVVRQKLAAYGHMGREDLGVKFEQTDMAEKLAELLKD